MKQLLIVALLMLGISNLEAGEYQNGNDLLRLFENCDEYEAGQTTHDNYRACGSSSYYVTGIHDAHDELALDRNFQKIYCSPPELTQGQLGSIVYKYLKENPVNLYQGAASQVLLALKDAYPCN